MLCEGLHPMLNSIIAAQNFNSHNVLVFNSNQCLPYQGTLSHFFSGMEGKSQDF